MTFKKSDKYDSGLRIYGANETDIDFSLIPSTDTTTVKAVEDYIEANFTFNRMFAWEGQNLSLDSTQEEQVLEASECDLWEIDRSNIFTAQYNGNIYSVRDETVISQLATLIGGKYETEATTPVSITGEALWTNAVVGDIVRLANKNGDNTVVTSVVVDLAGTPLVSDTDYVLAVDDWTLGRKGDSYINFILAKTGVLDADYDYTPVAKYRIGKSSNRATKPYTILKCVSCATVPDAGGIAVSDYFYLVKAYLNAPFDISFPKWTAEFTPAPMNFATARGGEFVWNFATLN